MTPVLISLGIFKSRYKNTVNMFFTEQIKSIDESVVSVTTVYAAKMIGSECILNATEIINPVTIIDYVAVSNGSNQQVFYSLENKCETEDDAIALALNAIV